MGNDALFGRYWAADSVVHRLDPRTKLVGTIALVIVMFCATNFWALGFVALVVIALFALARIPFTQALRSILPLSFIVVLTALFNLLFVQGGEVYVDWGWLTISQEGVRLALFTAIRLTLLLLSGSLLTLTTTTLDITEAFEKLLWPLRRIGVPAHEFALVMGIALRFLPQFVDEFRTIRAAQLSRGAKLASSPTKSGLSSLTSLLVPLFASAFRHADTLSAAMDARCYHGADGRTRLHPLAFAKRDASAAAFLAITFAITIALSLML
ncbi:MAG: energy-coupling factor transporter transmembrane protein EcfT [Eggerthellaceae bacterium]|nr:energy-coupling factor transporter transmembrane protein EcfT [Eggerthellaceae bacterium]MBQ9044159.1 energy-coupling factor transporter transmembrane protein EcfT [Eggerthellaceae bacterium]